MLIGPERTELATRRARLSALQSDVARAAATAKRLPQLEQEIATLERSLVATTAVLPDEKDAQDVLRQLHALASESELSLTSFTPKAVTEKSQYPNGRSSSASTAATTISVGSSIASRVCRCWSRCRTSI